MRLLLGDDLPAQLLPLLRDLLPGHEIEHAGDLRGDGASRGGGGEGYDVLLTGGPVPTPDAGGTGRPARHHVLVPQRPGLAGLGRTVAAVSAAIVPLVADLERADGPRVARIVAVSPGGRYVIGPDFPDEP